MLFFQLDDAAVLITFGIFIISAILLGLSFTAVAYIISLLVSEKSKAAGFALITWFLFALAFDLALLALLVGIEHDVVHRPVVGRILNEHDQGPVFGRDERRLAVCGSSARTGHSSQYE